MMVIMFMVFWVVWLVWCICWKIKFNRCKKVLKIMGNLYYDGLNLLWNLFIIFDCCELLVFRYVMDGVIL